MRAVTEVRASSRRRRAVLLAAGVVLVLGVVLATFLLRSPAPDASGWIWYTSPSALQNADVITVGATRDPSTGQCENGGWVPMSGAGPGGAGFGATEVAQDPTLCERKFVVGTAGTSRP